jgi:hypothetical protein
MGVTRAVPGMPLTQSRTRVVLTRLQELAHALDDLYL